MNLNDILNDIYESKNEIDLFDSLCELEYFIENKGNHDFFEERTSKKGDKFLILKNDFTVLHICNIFENQFFKNSIKNILKYQRDYKELKSVPNVTAKDGYFVNLYLNCCFYFISNYSNSLNHSNLHYIGDYFWGEIKNIEKDYSYEFNKIDILNAFESLIFSGNFFYKKDFCKKIDGKAFYDNLKISRLIIGNYIIDFSIPILLSNSFKKIISLKEKIEKPSLKDSSNRLNAIIKKFNFLNDGFKLNEKDNFRNIHTFKNYFEKRESRKILLLINFVMDGLDNFSHEEFIHKMELSKNTIITMKEYFYNNYSIFPDYKGPKNETGQWSNKSFLNTIKLFTILDVVKKSDNTQWKINIFLKSFNDWIYDLHDNINYFSELDDYDKIHKHIKFGESEVVEFKSTFGLPIQDYNKEALDGIKKSILDKIAKTILAMANSSGGNIYIGIVEKIEEVSDKVKLNIVEKDGINFLDINYSLKQEKEDLDSKRLSLQQILHNLTKERLDYLDSLFSFHFYKIYIENKESCIEILNIKVKKADKLIFIKKDDVYITLPKRLNGRVELVNPETDFVNK